MCIFVLLLFGFDFRVFDNVDGQLCCAGTKNVIDACVEQKVKRLIYTSSPSVVFDGVHSIVDGDESLSYPPTVGTIPILNLLNLCPYSFNT